MTPRSRPDAFVPRLRRGSSSLGRSRHFEGPVTFIGGTLPRPAHMTIGSIEASNADRPTPHLSGRVSPCSTFALRAAAKAHSGPTRRRRRQDQPAVKQTPRRRWYWRFLLVLGVALGIDFLVDDKLIFAALALIWIVACYFTLWRLRKAKEIQ